MEIDNEGEGDQVSNDSFYSINFRDVSPSVPPELENFMNAEDWSGIHKYFNLWIVRADAYARKWVTASSVLLFPFGLLLICCSKGISDRRVDTVGPDLVRNINIAFFDGRSMCSWQDGGMLILNTTMLSAFAVEKGQTFPLATDEDYNIPPHLQHQPITAQAVPVEAMDGSAHSMHQLIAPSAHQQKQAAYYPDHQPLMVPNPHHQMHPSTSYVYNPAVQHDMHGQPMQSHIPASRPQMFNPNYRQMSSHA